MLVAGLEPARGCPRQILSLLRLPFRHTSNGRILPQTYLNFNCFLSFFLAFVQGKFYNQYYENEHIKKENREGSGNGLQRGSETLQGLHYPENSF